MSYTVTSLLYRYRNLFIKLLVGCAFIFTFASEVSASSEPSFPACVNPQGAIVANYASGTHGIVGNTSVYTGSDTVYMSSDVTYVQCFCPENSGEGIQTNWWKITDISQEEVDFYKNLGWIFVPNGTNWGLTNDPYLAKNTSYTCRTSTNSSSSSSSNSSSSVGGVLSSLANTGNTTFLYVNAFLALSFILLGVYLHKKS